MKCANCGKKKEPIYICVGIEDYQLVHECLECVVVAAERLGAEKSREQHYKEERERIITILRQPFCKNIHEVVK